MNEVITDNLDLWTSALLAKSSAGRGSSGKQETYGIKKLRELILELAVRGKLVPQDPNDEPASVLLERIAEAEARLIEERKIRKEKPLPDITEEEQPYDLPNGWVFVTLGDVAFSQAGFAFESTFFNENGEGLPLIRIRDVGQLFSGTYYSGEYREEFLALNGDYLISMDGEFRVSRWENGQALLNQRVSRLIFFDETVGKRFIADSLQARLRELQGVKAYTTVDHLSGTQIAEAVIGLPPLAEQHRIVAKVDEIMVLCDELEEQQTRSIEAHQTLVETLLGTLTRAASPQELSEAWARIANHFDTLFTTEHSIDQLKQTTLQLAVMGKLVPQDPNDEDVRVLLTRNDQRRCEVAQTDRRADPDQQPILSVDDRWEIPGTWTWRGLGDLVLFVDYRGKTPAKQSSGIRLLTAKNVRKAQIDLSPEEFLSERDYTEWMTRGLPKAGDVLFTTEAPMGNAAVVDLNERFALAQRVICFQGYGALDPAFLVLQISSSQFQSILDRNGTGMTAKGIKASKLKQLPVAIPPLAEQHRIVAKVDELMALCDALKVRINEARTTQVYLADAIVAQVVANGGGDWP